MRCFLLCLSLLKIPMVFAAEDYHLTLIAHASASISVPSSIDENKRDLLT